MKLSFLTLSSLILATTATPVTLNFVEGDAPLEKRSSETVYLSNCNIFGTPVYSQINASNTNLLFPTIPLTLIPVLLQRRQLSERRAAR